MAIKATCSSCNSTFNAKDTLAGRRVKCPKCGDKMTVPEKKAVKARTGRKVNPTAGSFDVMDELLKEANVKSVARGNVCDDCGAELPLGAVICVECGFNTETGSRLRTDMYDEENESDAGETAAQRMLRQAEKDIEETPIGADDQDFGDGAESFVIAGVAGIILAIMIGLALLVVFLMENLSEAVHSSQISMIAAITMTIGCGIWITIVAFFVKKSQGIICVATLGLYCMVFGFMQGKQLLLPTIVMIVSILIAAASGYYSANYAPSL